MTWLIFAISSSFLYAVVQVINKFLLGQRAITKPLVYAFWVGVFSIFTLVLAPFGLSWPGWNAFFYDIIVGLIYFVSILFFYEAMDINEASRVSSIVGGLIPVLVLILSYLFLSESLTPMQLFAFFLLVMGGFLISVKKSGYGVKAEMNGLWFVALAIFFGAIYWIAAKYAFDNQGFITGFVWTRLGFVVAAAAILLKPAWRKMIFVSKNQASRQIGGLFISNKLLAGFASLLAHLALSLGSAALVYSLNGVQYVFLLIFAIILTKKFPSIMEEKITRRILIKKFAVVLLIGAGLAILATNSFI